MQGHTLKSVTQMPPINDPRFPAGFYPDGTPVPPQGYSQQPGYDAYGQPPVAPPQQQFDAYGQPVAPYGQPQYSQQYVPVPPPPVMPYGQQPQGYDAYGQPQQHPQPMMPYGHQPVPQPQGYDAYGQPVASYGQPRPPMMPYGQQPQPQQGYDPYQPQSQPQPQQGYDAYGQPSPAFGQPPAPYGQASGYDPYAQPVPQPPMGYDPYAQSQVPYGQAPMGYPAAAPTYGFDFQAPPALPIGYDQAASGFANGPTSAPAPAPTIEPSHVGAISVPDNAPRWIPPGSDETGHSVGNGGLLSGLASEPGPYTGAIEQVPGATTALLISIGGFLLPLLGIIGFFNGRQALETANASRGRYSGHGVAKAAIGIGLLTVVGWFAIIAYYWLVWR